VADAGFPGSDKKVPEDWTKAYLAAPAITQASAEAGFKQPPALPPALRDARLFRLLSWIGGAAWFLIFLAVAVIKCPFCDGHSGFWIAVGLSGPLTILVSSLSMRQYHRFRSSLQALIVGRIAKQAAVDDAARAARQAAETAKKPDPIEKLQAHLDFQFGNIATTMAGNQKELETADQHLADTLRLVADRLAALEDREGR
jgi:hypothetical protein